MTVIYYYGNFMTMPVAFPFGNQFYPTLEIAENQYLSIQDKASLSSPVINGIQELNILAGY